MDGRGSIYLQMPGRLIPQYDLCASEYNALMLSRQWVECRIWKVDARRDSSWVPICGNRRLREEQTRIVYTEHEESKARSFERKVGVEGNDRVKIYGGLKASLLLRGIASRSIM